ncbi:unnamed protein product [Vitrella brassicaformis CCMP3155]|uniref:RNA-editing substrate-binding complex 6 protein domain-containing protein n=1 Tax=Vitrella brassicaformis (strain CCMP3155) TaxID=1169540 RepID=A0A0G4H2F7_VITBC|nr:unnamed protein product [Vitrella brassicaformis CCMP3155]|eukprot:CEM37803.1 unnamed protein product [Vitrella brassicaformis CCMP3155]
MQHLESLKAVDHRKLADFIVTSATLAASTSSPPSPLLWRSYAARAVQVANEFTPGDLTRILTALGKVPFRHPPDLLSALSTNIRDNLTDLDKQTKFDLTKLSICLNAFARLKHRDNDLLLVVSRYLRNTLEAQPGDHQALSLLVNSLARFDYRDQPLLSAIAAKIKPVLFRLNAQDFATLCNAFSKLGTANERFFHDVATAMQGHLSLFPAAELAMVANAYARADIRHLHLFQLLSSHSQRRIEEFTPQGVVMIVSAFSKVTLLDDTALLESIAARVRRLFRSSPPNGGFKIGELTMLANGYGNVHLGGASTLPHETVEEVFTCVADALLADPLKLRGLSAKNLSILSRAFARAGISQPDLFRLFIDRLAQVAEQMSFKDLADVGYALERFDLPPTKAAQVVFLNRFSTLLREKEAESDTRSFATVLLAMANLQMGGLHFCETAVEYITSQPPHSRIADSKKTLPAAVVAAPGASINRGFSLSEMSSIVKALRKFRLSMGQEEGGEVAGRMEGIYRKVLMHLAPTLARQSEELTQDDLSIVLYSLTRAHDPDRHITHPSPLPFRPPWVDESILLPLARTAERLTPRLSGRNLALVIGALGTLPPEYESCLRCFKGILDRLCEGEVMSGLEIGALQGAVLMCGLRGWGEAMLGRQGMQQVVNRVGRQVCRSLQESPDAMRPRLAAFSMDCFAATQVHEEKWLRSLLAYSAVHASSFTPTDVAVVLSSLAVMQLRDAPTLHSLTHHGPPDPPDTLGPKLMESLSSLDHALPKSWAAPASSIPHKSIPTVAFGLALSRHAGEAICSSEGGCESPSVLAVAVALLGRCADTLSWGVGGWPWERRDTGRLQLAVMFFHLAGWDVSTRSPDAPASVFLTCLPLTVLVFLSRLIDVAPAPEGYAAVQTMVDECAPSAGRTRMEKVPWERERGDVEDGGEMMPGVSSNDELHSPMLQRSVHEALRMATEERRRGLTSMAH